ncbi:MAG: ribonuclease HII [Anaerolineaceae bacterium]
MTAGFDPALIPAAPTLEYEQALWQQGKRLVAGLDEAGRGALAGPIYAAAVVLPYDDPKVSEKLSGVRDSKQLTPKEREKFAPVIREMAIAWGLGWGEAAEIDRIGIAKAGRVAFVRALEALGTQPDHLLLDYFALPEAELGQTALVKGDQRSLSIACASILAKTARDEVMRTAGERFQGYGFGCNKGYGTLKHRRAITELGPCALHRRSFRLVGEN